jgi:hypothetical protein
MKKKFAKICDPNIDPPGHTGPDTYLQLEDPALNGVVAQELVDRHLTLLAHPVDAVARLHRHIFCPMP